jgi:hypothetical protein
MVRVIRIRLFNATFNNISVIFWWSVILVEETRLPEKTTLRNISIYKYTHKRLTSFRGRRGRDRMVVRFTTTYAIGAYHH